MQIESQVKIEWAKANKLDLYSSPVHWFEAFLPLKNNNTAYSMQHSLKWTNQRGMLDHYALGGKDSFTPFSLEELMKHVGLYFLHGLSRSPQIEMKFRSQSEDPVNGNDFVHNAFGSKSTVSRDNHRRFKKYFSSQDPNKPVPSRDDAPNWKVQPLLTHMMNVSKAAFHIGRDVSCDEQTIGFQGNHRDKQRITYKKEGDGFLADCICSKGYTYAFHFRHQQASEKIMKSGSCSPLHARVLGLISQLPHKYYTLGMDNLYMSAKFCRLAFSMDQRVMVHGVTRPSLRGIPSIIKQDEVTTKSNLEKVRNTVKVAVLKGDEVIKDLVAVSIYDTKPVYLLSNACERVEWVSKEKKVFDSNQNKMFPLKFHRLNVIDFYNFNMGNVDQADQLRNHYRIDSSWHRNRKWWWAVWWWGVQVLLTNSYVAYKSYHFIHDSKEVKTHYEYIKDIALAWVNRDTYWPKEKEFVSSQDSNGIMSPDDGIAFTRARKRLHEEISSSSSSKICSRVSDKALDPHRGALSCRLNTTVQHFPQKPNSKSKRCALHRWARGKTGKEIQANVMMCGHCRVQLCIECFSLFHREAFLTKKKVDASVEG